MERGEAVSEKHVSFEKWETMVRVLSPRQMEMLLIVRHAGCDGNTIIDCIEVAETSGLIVSAFDPSFESPIPLDPRASPE